MLLYPNSCQLGNLTNFPVLGKLRRKKNNCRSLVKVKFSTDQFRPALGSGGCSIVTMLKKPQNCPISDFFDLYPNTFCPYCLIQTWYRLLLTQYHQVPTSTTIYQQITTNACLLDLNFVKILLMIVFLCDFILLFLPESGDLWWWE